MRVRIQRLLYLRRADQAVRPLSIVCSHKLNLSAVNTGRRHLLTNTRRARSNDTLCIARG